MRHGVYVQELRKDRKSEKPAILPVFDLSIWRKVRRWYGRL